MTSGTLSLAVAGPDSGSFFPQMLRAETKKLTRRKGVAAFAIIGTVGVVLVTFVILEIYHLSDPVKYSSIGGVSGFDKLVLILGELTIIPASILGSTSGSQDVESGVVRDMIVTGRSRISLFLLRLEGAIVVWLILQLTAFLIGLIVVFGLAGGAKLPGLHLVVEGGLYCLGTSSVFLLTAAGLAGLFGTRGPAIAIMIGWTFVIEVILVNVAALGPIREAFLTTAMAGLSPIPDGARRLKHLGLSPSVLVDYVTIIGWPLVMNILGWIRFSKLEA